jgi:hypothetical protein
MSSSKFILSRIWITIWEYFKTLSISHSITPFSFIDSIIIIYHNAHPIPLIVIKFSKIYLLIHFFYFKVFILLNLMNVKNIWFHFVVFQQLNFLILIFILIIFLIIIICLT